MIDMAFGGTFIQGRAFNKKILITGSDITACLLAMCAARLLSQRNAERHSQNLPAVLVLNGGYHDSSRCARNAKGVLGKGKLELLQELGGHGLELVQPER